jgi:uncharacterized protein YbjT (DUF2867 family)
METNQSIILITGATGFTGGALVRRLSAKGVPVRALVRNIAKAKALGLYSLPNVEVVEGDMAISGSLTEALKGVDRAMLISTSDPAMVEVQSNFIETARKFDIKHIVKLSGIIADVHSPFRYARMHGEIEKKLESSGIAFTHLRAGEFMQSYFRQIPSILAKSSMLIPMEGQRIASIDTADIAEVAAIVLTASGHEGKAYSITGPESLTMTEVAEKLSAILGKTINYINVPPLEAKKAQLSAGLPQYTADALEELFAERRKGKESQVYDTMQRVFGLKSTSFEEFVLKNLAIFKGEVQVPKF